jgi:hypothetical protein
MNTLSKAAGLALALYAITAGYSALISKGDNDWPTSGARADVDYLHKAMDRRMVTLPIVGPGVMKAMGIEAILFADDHVSVEMPSGLSLKIRQLDAISRGFADYADVIGFDPAGFDTVIGQGEMEAKSGLWSLEDFNHLATLLVDLDHTLDMRAQFSVSYMNGNDFTQTEALDFSALTMSYLMDASKTANDTDLFSMMFSPNVQQLHTDVQEIWGGLETSISDLQVITADREAVPFDLVSDEGPSL